MFKALIKYILIFIYLSSALINSAIASDVYDGPRPDMDSYNTFNEAKNECQVGQISDFDITGHKKDNNWDLSNAHCQAFVGGIGAAFVAGQFLLNYLCKSPVLESQAEIGPNLPPSPIPTPLWLAHLATGTIKCGRRIAEAANPANKIAYPPPTLETIATNCCASTAALYGIFATAVTSLGIIHGSASVYSNHVNICGGDWQTWKEFKEKVPTEEGEKEKDVSVWKNIKGPYNQCLQMLFVYNGKMPENPEDKGIYIEWPNDCKNYKSYDGLAMVEEDSSNSNGYSYPSKVIKDNDTNKNYGEKNASGTVVLKSNSRLIQNQFYREFIYGGMEHIDKDSECRNPWYDGDAKQKQLFMDTFGYFKDKQYQRYYLVGSGENFKNNFACSRYVPADLNERPKVKKHFDCCSKRSREAICLEYDNEAGPGNIAEKKFCKINSKCTIQAGTLSIYPAQSEKHIGYICAKTYSFCPYNFTVGLGTEIANTAEGNSYKNFCQYLRHCTKSDFTASFFTMSFEGKGAAYLSDACSNLRGDSQNFYQYQINSDPSMKMNFSAPIAQCFKETITNFLMNKAGNSKCSDPDIYPDADGICAFDNPSDYIYKKGEYLEQYPSILETIKQKYLFAVKLALILVIVLFGYMVLMGRSEVLNKKTIAGLVIKIAVAMYFVLGDAWQSYFIEGVMDISTQFSNLTFRPYVSSIDEFVKDNLQDNLDKNGYTQDQVKLKGIQRALSNAKSKAFNSKKEIIRLELLISRNGNDIELIEQNLVLQNEALIAELSSLVATNQSTLTSILSWTDSARGRGHHEEEPSGISDGLTTSIEDTLNLISADFAIDLSDLSQIQAFADKISSIIENIKDEIGAGNDLYKTLKATYDSLQAELQCYTNYDVASSGSGCKDTLAEQIKLSEQEIIELENTISENENLVSQLTGEAAASDAEIKQKQAELKSLQNTMNAKYTQAYQDLRGNMEQNPEQFRNLYKDLDGCQFPRYPYKELKKTNDRNLYLPPEYPPGKDYLKMWDTLDCKIGRALGLAPDISIPNLILMVIGSFFTGGMGILFFFGAFFFAFFLIAITLRALHIFIMSVLAIAVLIYVSPITIVCALFSKTQEIFQNWYKQLVGISLQPMILFAYVGVMVTLFDHFVIGDAQFTPTVDPGVERALDCSVGDAENNSLYCIFRIADIKSYTGLEALGIGLPVLASLNSAKVNTIFQGALMMYIFSKFMDQITKIASKLLGGAQLSSGTMSAGQMMSKAYNSTRAVQKRAKRAAIKGGKAINDSHNKATKGGEDNSKRVGGGDESGASSSESSDGANRNDLNSNGGDSNDKAGGSDDKKDGESSGDKASDDKGSSGDSGDGDKAGGDSGDKNGDDKGGGESSGDKASGGEDNKGGSDSGGGDNAGGDSSDNKSESSGGDSEEKNDK